MEDQSAEIGELAKALSLAQSEMEGAKKDGKNPFFKSDYSTLFAVWDACRGPLTKNGLSIIQTTGGTDSGMVTVYTILAHSSGQWIRSALSIKPEKPGPQALGSCITYLRRYSLAGVVGLSPLDDDAESATKHQNPKQPTKSPEINDKADSPIKAMIGKFSKAKTVLNEMTGSNEVYYAALETIGVKHCNEIKKVDTGNKLLAEFRTFVKGTKDEQRKPASRTPGDDGSGFPPAED